MARGATVTLGPVIVPAVPQELVVRPVRRGLVGHRRLTVGADGVTFHSGLRTRRVSLADIRFLRSLPGAGEASVRVQVSVSDRTLPTWTLRDDDWLAVKDALSRLAPTLAIDPPPPRPIRVAADAALRTGDNPVESLRTVRRAMIGRWWVQVRPWSPGFRAEAHTLRGPQGVWAGEWRATLGEATDDAIAMIEELRRDE